MLPPFLLFWLVLEVTAYYLLARGPLALDGNAAALAALAILLVGRAWQNAFTWWLAARHRSPGASPGLTVIIGEYLAFLLTFLLVIPFERLWMPPDRLAGGRRVVLLVHGYGCSRGAWWLLRRRLEAAGFTVATLSLFPPFTSMGRLVPQLQARIEAVCRATGAARLTLVGHSMGGLIARSCLARHGHAQVEQLITLATPHAGTELARFGLGQNAREMQPDSLWLHDMANEPTGVPTLALRNPCDNYVMPQDNQTLPGARNADLPPLGHLALLYHRRVADIVVAACSEGSSR